MEEEKIKLLVKEFEEIKEILVKLEKRIPEFSDVMVKEINELRGRIDGLESGLEQIKKGN